MKKKDFTDLKKKDLKSLIKLASDKKIEAGKARMDIVTGKSKNLKGYSNLRRETAKILTLIREMEIVEKLNKEGILK